MAASVSELLGTFFLVLVGAGGAVVTAKSNGAISRSTAVAAPGLMVTAIILFMGAISSTHLNPAVTLAFAARRDFPWRRVPGYVLIQLIGATLACLFLWAVLGKLGGLGATEPGAGTSDWRAMLIELILTVGLVSTILGTASRAQNVGALSAVAVGGYIILAGFWSSPISGASMNPARSFGPDLANGDFANYWVYLLGPTTGALIAVAFAYLLRGPGGTPAEPQPPKAPSINLSPTPQPNPRSSAGKAGHAAAADARTSGLPSSFDRYRPYLECDRERPHPT